MNFQSSKLQAPSSRENSSSKLQAELRASLVLGLVIGIWSFFGAWMLALGASTYISA
jgi:hypothetical protein